MRINLANGYFVDERANEYTLKLSYIGTRKGESVECEKIVAHCKSFEDAAERFLSLVRTDLDNDMSISLNEYVNRIIEENRKAIESIQLGSMERLYFYVPCGNGERVEHTVADLIPIGRDNAITRGMLLSECRKNNIATTDRSMRKLIEKARIDYTILNLSDGDGYYRPSHDDLLDLRRYIRQEENRAKSVFKNLSMARKLYEDYKTGRI